MRRVTAIAVAATPLLGGLATAVAWFGRSQRAVATAPQPTWTEVAWPSPCDQWGKRCARPRSASGRHPKTLTQADN